jgi:hypothetical protein
LSRMGKSSMVMDDCLSGVAAFYTLAISGFSLLRKGGPPEGELNSPGRFLHQFYPIDHHSFIYRLSVYSGSSFIKGRLRNLS